MKKNEKSRNLLVMGFVAVMSASILTAFNASAKAVDVNQNNYQEIIKQQVTELNGVGAEDMKVIELGDDSSVSTQNINDTGERALEVVTETDGVIEHKIIILKRVVGNELVNSFTYAEEMLDDTGDYGVMPMADVPFYLTDTTLNTSSYYKINPYTNMGFEKRTDFEIYKQYPTKGTVYGDWAQAMNDNYGLMCNNLTVHGGRVGYSINYTVNGVTKYDRGSRTLFGK